ncbi:MAG: AAA family ATPase [Spirochaetaceae bacterium]|nr:AAA family ATPase [Spirochaetaceae bacterium]
MKPEKLTIENFGPFTGRETVDFTVLEDIFLITGRTGSGKTTIFDALCFALYGAVPGSRKGHISRLRSDYAGDGVECSVSLLFSAGGRRYRIDRSPRQEKPKKRGTGVTTVEETAVLSEIRDGTAAPLSGKKSEADEQIRRLIGLEAEEFFKIVLLPQGEFAEFLRQNTTGRRAVLGKLFPVDKAARLRELAQEKARAAVLEAREAGRALEEISRRVSFGTLEETRRKAEEAVREAKAAAAAVALETETMKALLAARRNEAALTERLEAAEKETARNDAEEGAVQENQKRLALSRIAQPLAYEVKRVEEKEREAVLAAEAAEKTRKEREAAQDRAEQAEIRAAALPGLEREEHVLREKRPALLELAAEEETLRKNRKDAALLGKRIQTLSDRIDHLGAQKREKEAEIQNLEAAAQNAVLLDARWERERRTKDLLVELGRIAVEAGTLDAEECAAGLRIAALEGECGELETRIPIQEAEVRRLRTEKEERERTGMAALLGAGLREGEPCPVCGSTEHPNPAAQTEPVYGYASRIAAQEKSLADAGKALAAKQAEREGREQERARLYARRKALSQSTAEIRSEAAPQDDPVMAAWFSRGGELPDTTDAVRLREAQIAALNAVTAARSEAQRAAKRLTEAHREQRLLERDSTEAEKEYAGLVEKHTNLLSAIEETTRKQARLLDAACDEEGVPSADAALAELDGRLLALTGEIRRRRQDGEEAGRNLASALAHEESARQKQEAGETALLAAEETLTAALSSSPFPDRKALTSALLDGKTESALEAAHAQWKEERTTLRSLRAELQRNLEALGGELAVLGAAWNTGEIPSGAEAEARLADLTAGQEAAEAERDRKTGELAAFIRDEALLRETHERFTAASRVSRRLSALADDLGGKNPRKRAFDAWLLGRYLAEAAACATRRLERMSESRYSLLLDSGRESGRGQSGLDLAVFDAYTGKCRPCATLSGGESFMASISLALGLADSIQNRSGGVRLDAVFIDEGFGSLDETSLDRALVILDELRDHRMVGLISHVGELRSRIPSRIEVIKSGSGSRIQQ